MKLRTLKQILRELDNDSLALVVKDKKLFWRTVRAEKERREKHRCNIMRGLGSGGKGVWMAPF